MSYYVIGGDKEPYAVIPNEIYLARLTPVEVVAQVALCKFFVGNPDELEKRVRILHLPGKDVTIEEVIEGLKATIKYLRKKMPVKHVSVDNGTEALKEWRERTDECIRALHE